MGNGRIRMELLSTNKHRKRDLQNGSPILHCLWVSPTCLWWHPSPGTGHSESVSQTQGLSNAFGIIAVIHFCSQHMLQEYPLTHFKQWTKESPTSKHAKREWFWLNHLIVAAKCQAIKESENTYHWKVISKPLPRLPKCFNNSHSPCKSEFKSKVDSIQFKIFLFLRISYMSILYLNHFQPSFFPLSSSLTSPPTPGFLTSSVFIIHIPTLMESITLHMNTC